MNPQPVSGLKIGDLGDGQWLAGPSDFHIDARSGQIKSSIIGPRQSRQQE
jgi:hypothetical protein